MKNLTKSIILGTVTLGCGTVIGWKLCKAAIVSMLHDKEFMEKAVGDILGKMEKKIGKEKLERMAKIYYERDTIPEVIFSKRSEAEEVLTYMLSLMEEYKIVTVADFNDLIGQTSTFQDNKLGWTDLKNATIKRVYTGYLFDLPDPQSIQ